MATIDLGKIKQVWRGTWSNSPNPAYSVDDLVEYTDTGVTSTYIAVSTPGSQVPSSGGSVQSNWNLVAKGVADPIPTQSSSTNGKVLKSDGSSASWGDGGGWTRLAEGVGNGTSQINVDNIFSSTYKFYKINYSFASDSWLRIYLIDSSGSVQTAAGYYLTGFLVRRDNGSTYSQNFGDYNYVGGTANWWNGSNDAPAVGELNFADPMNSSFKTFWYGHCCYKDNAWLAYQNFTAGYDSAQAHRGIAFSKATGSGDNFSTTNFYYNVMGYN